MIAFQVIELTRIIFQKIHSIPLIVFLTKNVASSQQNSLVKRDFTLSASWHHLRYELTAVNGDSY